MMTYRKSNYLVITVVVAMFATSATWGASQPDDERAADRDSAGSNAITTSVDQDGNLVISPTSITTVQTEMLRPRHLDVAEPDTVTQGGPAVSANAAIEPDGDASSPLVSQILDPTSSQFSFQALLTDAAGDPLPGPDVQLVFNIYDGVGTLLEGPIGPFLVPVTNGIVDTQIPVTPKFFDGTARELGVIVDGGAELSPRVILVAVPYALRVDRVASDELDDIIDLGAVDANGELRVWGNAANLRTIVMKGSTHTVTVYGADSTSNIVLDGEPFGELRMRDQTGNDQTVSLNATANSGGELSLSSSAGAIKIFADGGAGSVEVTNNFKILDAIPGNEVMSVFRYSSGVGGAQLRFRDGSGTDAMQGGTSTSGGGFLALKQTDGGNGVFIGGGAGVDAGGMVNVYDAADNVTIDLNGNSHRIDMTADNGEARAQLSGSSTGVLSLYDGNGFQGTAVSERTVFLSAGPDLLIGTIGPGNDFGGQLILDDSDGTAAIYMNGGNSSGTGTRIATTGSHQVLSSITATATVLGSLEPGSSGGVLFLRQGDGIATVELDGDAGTNAGGDLTIRAADGSSTIFIDGDSSSAGLIQVRDNVSSTRVQLDGESTGTGGEISVYDNNGTETIELLGDEAAGGEGSAQIMLRNSAGVDRIEIDADGGNGSRIQLLNTAGTGVVMDSEVNGGGRIRVRNAANSSRIFIDGDYNGTGLSRIRADVFRVQGGVDLAEPFECKDTELVQPGMVMSIDPTSPGKLMRSTEAYDRKVAGIISGAGGVRPGITLSQEGVMDDGLLVALTGRVYCLADASNGAINPGDLLTTSSVPGHAMKVKDHGRAQGAIIGKAMTSLETGKGLVLVLVQPQ